MSTINGDQLIKSEVNITEKTINQLFIAPSESGTITLVTVCHMTSCHMTSNHMTSSHMINAISFQESQDVEYPDGDRASIKYATCTT